MKCVIPARPTELYSLVKADVAPSDIMMARIIKEYQKVFVAFWYCLLTRTAFVTCQGDHYLGPSNLVRVKGREWHQCPSAVLSSSL